MPASALVVGSMMPDFEYFIKMKLSGRFSHTLPGAFVFCLPVAFVVLVAFHIIIKKPLIDNLPRPMYGRLTPLRDFDFIASLKKHPLVYVMCLLAGIFSHLLWDSFTHANFMERHVAWLSYPVSLPGFGSYPVFRYLQHLSTVLGGAYIVYFFCRLPHTGKINKPNPYFFSWVALLTAIIYGLRWWYGFQSLGDRVVALISALFLSLLMVCWFFKYNTAKFR